MELDVHWQGGQPERVGRLYQAAGGEVYFEYDEAWRAGGRELSPLHLPTSTGGAVTCGARGFGGLHGLFHDTLPDWWGEQMMRRFFEERGIPWRKINALRKLACQGDRKMGALAFSPVIDGDDFNDGMLVELGGLVDAARASLRGERGELLEGLMKSGMSPGGAQPKALLAVSGDFSEIRLDDPAPDGFSAWLVKFGIDAEAHEARVEAAYAAMARAAGIDLPETRLVEAGGAAHFFVKRFDRTADGGRVHLHSFSGMTHTPLGDGIEYGDLMNLARALTRDERQVEQLFRRAVFNVIAANDDDHGRNHAFLMDDSGSWRLSPAFDLTHASYPLASGFRAGKVMGRSVGITRKLLEDLGKSQGVNRVAAIIDQVRDAVADWPRHAKGAGVPAYLTRQVGEDHGLA